MSNLSKRSTIYFDPSIHQALKVKSVTSSRSVSELVDEALRQLMNEDQEDLEAYAQRKDEPDINYEELLNDLKQHGKI
ncbi:MAG: hypothetical protein U1D41_12200 [Nitrosomonas sp.]|uniref:hypothetical protein n=1 Tax=Nitrosomonas sp. TaxID=42353 RepID=UPI0027343A59|nr:hypothetical protein [Nitrosomonas sp.]MBK6958397.1 CopG family transcriptional regulator [Nitrosomonas sp.]MDP3222689.1 CopG family transcriptional regulator [Rubrivivax sp.]MDP3662509.1 hypothetical protein [Nitrosomonas sp.]MDZ4106896.1 hypothetical protein [Nitrosomonas sp.]